MSEGDIRESIAAIRAMLTEAGWLVDPEALGRPRSDPYLVEGVSVDGDGSPVSLVVGKIGSSLVVTLTKNGEAVFMNDRILGALAAIQATKQR